MTVQRFASVFEPKRGSREKELAVTDLGALTDHFSCHHNAQLELRRHPRARNLTLRVNTANRKIVTTIPKRASRREAVNFILTNYAWVIERLAHAPETMPFADGNMVPLRGQPHQIRFVDPARGRGVVKALATPDGLELHVAGQPEHCPRRLKDWLVKQAKIDLEARARHHSDALGVDFKRITVRDQASRWGSCSSSGTLSFSWRLVLAPPEILDYVAAHEVAHLKEMNHSPAFWRLVAHLCPGFKKAERWLTHDGPDLHRYSPTNFM